MFDFGRGSALDPAGELIALRQNHSWIYEVLLLNLVTSFSGKLLKIVATRCHILRRKCTKFDLGCGSAPDPAGGAYSTPPDSLAGIEGAYF